MKLRVGTYNLLDGGGDRWQRQVEMLASLELDVLALQEAKHWDRKGLSRMFDTARALRMQARLARSASHGCHLVTLYQWPDLELLDFEEDLGCGSFHHTASRARFLVDGDRTLTVLHTHADPFSPEDRLAEAGWLTEYAASGQMSVLVGDLNTIGLTDEDVDDWRRIPAHLHSRHRLILPDGSYGGTDRRSMAALIAAGYVDPPVQLKVPAGRTAGYWKPDELWDHRSDYALVSPRLAPGLRSYKVEDTAATRNLGDHLPVVATVDVAAL